MKPITTICANCTFAEREDNKAEYLWCTKFDDEQPSSRAACCEYVQRRRGGKA